MASLEPEPGLTPEYDQLRSELVAAGFEPVEAEKGLWEGPLFDCFRSLAPGQNQMRIRIRDGFPYTIPKIYVEGIVSDHVAATDEVCPWETNDDSWTWLTLDQLEQRSIDWVAAHGEGFRPEDEVLDAHLYFERQEAESLAVVDLSSLKIGGEDKTAQLYGVWKEDERVLQLTPSRPQSGSPIEGRFYFHEGGVAVPPRDLGAFTATLSNRQKRNFERRLENVRKGETLVAALFWDSRHGGGRNALVLLLSPDEGEISAKALEVAPTDLSYRLLRAGPDAEDLQDRKAVVFGLGAVGSHWAICLAQCGFGALHLVDGAVIRPADLTRHRGFPFAGWSKVQSVGSLIRMHAAWVDVKPDFDSPWTPSRIKELIENADVVVDAVGSLRFTELLSIEAEKAGVPLVSAALYRQGAVSRIRRQAGGDTPIHARSDTDAYPAIPAPPNDEPRRLEPGCTEPVNNASPVRVLQVAAEATQITIDTTLGRVDGPEEVIEAHDPLDTAPYDRVGVIGGSE